MTEPFEVGTRIGFHGQNTGERYDGEIVDVTNNPDGGLMALVRPLLHETPWPSGTVVTDVSGCARWRQWVPATDALPAGLVQTRAYVPHSEADDRTDRVLIIDEAAILFRHMVDDSMFSPWRPDR